MNERGTTLLMEATNLKQLEVAKVLVAAHANVNAVSSAGLTPLYYALDDFMHAPNDSAKTVSALVHVLVEAGADVNAHGKGDMWKSPLAQASQRGDKELIAYLMSKQPKGAAVDPLAFIDAINAGNAATVKQLIAAGANLNPASPEMGMSPIHQAVSQGASAISMARYEKKDATALVAQWTAVVDLVIKAGANLEAQDDRGETPLDAAINGGVSEILNRVLAAKPKLDTTNGKGKTPLEYLADNHRLQEKELVPLAKAMRAQGAPANAKAAAIADGRKFVALAAALR
jgi:serine/threonine-protein phosphatase 6 regulatory ankyrin repeat subunit B